MDANAKCDGSFGKGTDHPIRSNLSGDWGSITLSSNGLEAYAVRNTIGQPRRIYRLTRKAETEEFGDPEEFVGGEDAGQWEQYDPALSPDDLSLFYVAVAPAGMPFDSGDILVSRRSSPDARFGPGTANRVLNDSNYMDDGPFVSHDGRTLFFASKRSGDSIYGIYYWQIDSLSSPTPLISLDTSNYHESSPVLTDDELTIFFASKRVGYPNVDIYMRHRVNATDGFGENIERLEEAPTLALESPDAISHDGCTLWYTAQFMGITRILTTTRSRD